MSTEEDPAQIIKLMEKVEELDGEANSLQLKEDSRQVSNTVAGYIVHKTAHLYRECYQSQLTTKEVSTENIGRLSRGELKNTSMTLSTVVSQ